MTDPGGDRLAILVHELRSPVAALAAIAETCKGGRVETSARRPLAELAIAACRGIERLVRDAAVASIRPEVFDIGRLVEESVAAAVLGGGNVRADVTSGLPLVTVDPVRMRQALDNLVSNAERYSDSGAEVVVSVRQADVAILLAVADSGPGVPVDERERIFETGVRLDIEGQGSGLGLAVARAIAEAHGGSLTVESVLGLGATFTIALPVDA